MDVSLQGTSTNDRAGIYETKGNYYPLDKTFKGSGGRINWAKVTLDSLNVFAELPASWQISLEKAEYSIDSAVFYFIGYLEKPLEGTVKDKIFANVTDPEAVKYPQFQSYDNSIRIKDILDRGLLRSFFHPGKRH